MDRAGHRAAVADTILERVGDGLALAHAGDRAGARALFDELWAIAGDDALHRCAIAHSMADVQDAAEDELVWDLRALEAAGALTDERIAAADILGPAGAFMPSLHLNLADVYRRLGDTAGASHHVAAGRAALGTLADDGYRDMIDVALTRVETALRTLG